MSKSNSSIRPSYSMIDVLNQALGLPTPEGHCVITKSFARDLIVELSRLYELEDELADRLQPVNAKEEICDQAGI